MSSTNTINFRIIIAFTLYLTSLLSANTLGLKIMPFIAGTHLSVAIFFFPFVLLTTDVIAQVYGRKMAKNFILAGALSILLFMLYSIISLALPWATDGLRFQNGYKTIFGISLRMSFASLLAYLIGEYQDVISFFFFKRKLAGQGFWLRSNLSNLWSQLLDSSIFMFVAFAGIYSTKTIILIIIPWWLYKVFMGFLYTPLSYLGIYLLQYDYKTH